mmetsp:Transcript_24301/g.31637  ORF Transcript_24301/g.31637 Transcript_24301/m.31637 type:complete len:381 (-) Transcript_24301:8-1150(-)
MASQKPSQKTNNKSTVSHMSLVGHKDSVGCVEWSHSLSLLASASDDGSVRIWDTRTGNKCVKAIFAFQKQPVQLVAWSPPQGAIPNGLWASAGRDVFCFDLRGNENMILREPTLTMRDVCNEGENDDEISSINVQPKGGEYIAAADDAGSVHLLKIGQSRREGSERRSLILERGPCLSAHENIVTGALFRPSTLRDVLSGSLDGSLKGWDISKPHKPIWSEHIRAPETEDSSKLLNPPLVHGIDVHSSGRYFAAALGDSSVSLHAFGKSPRCVSRFTGGHSTSVAQVHFTGFDPNLLLSVGNDMKIAFWPLEDILQQDKPKKGHVKDGAAEKGHDLVDTAPHARLAHTQKMNWISSSTISSAVHIADVSPIISVFDVSCV